MNQKHKETKDFYGYIENHYLCPTCNEWVSGRVSWYQQGKQKHFNCLAVCSNKVDMCEHKEMDRIKDKTLCEKAYRCKYKIKMMEAK